MRYAVSAADLLGIHNDIPVQTMLAPVLAATPVKVEPGQVSGMGIELDCEEDRALTIIEVVRKNYPRHKLRFYSSPARVRDGSGCEKAVARR